MTPPPRAAFPLNKHPLCARSHVLCPVCALPHKIEIGAAVLNVRTHGLCPFTRREDRPCGFYRHLALFPEQDDRDVRKLDFPRTLWYYRPSKSLVGSIVPWVGLGSEKPLPLPEGTALNWLIQALLRIPGLLVGITVHEFFHAYTAWKLGDDTPMLQGRVTLNPLAHLDPIGTILLLVVGFGWGRPVQVNPYNFRNGRQGDLLVSLFGPLSNLAVAIGFLLLLFVSFHFAPSHLASSRMVLIYGALAMGVWINVALMIFNLIPLHPLDGSHIMAAILPYEQRQAYEAFGRYSFFILIAIIWFFGQYLGTLISMVAQFLAAPLGLNLVQFIRTALRGI